MRRFLFMSEQCLIYCLQEVEKDNSLLHKTIRLYLIDWVKKFKPVNPKMYGYGRVGLHILNAMKDLRGIESSCQKRFLRHFKTLQMPDVSLPTEDGQRVFHVLFEVLYQAFEREFFGREFETVALLLTPILASRALLLSALGEFIKKVLERYDGDFWWKHLDLSGSGGVRFGNVLYEYGRGERSQHQYRFSRQGKFIVFEEPGIIWNLTGSSIQFSNSKQVKLLVSYPSDNGSEVLELCVKRLC